MKKLIYCALALAAGLFAASCQQENLEPVAQENTVTYTVEVPGVATKAYGEGQEVNQLIYEVWKTDETGEINDNAVRLYQVNNKELQLVEKVKRAQITLNLVKDQTYRILLWAQVQKEAGFENYNTDTLTRVSYKYNVASAYSANQEQYDAFYATKVISTFTAPKPEKISLKRPFAQLNIATENNVTDYTVTMNTSKVVVEGVPTVFNVATSEATALTTVTFNTFNVPEGTVTVTTDAQSKSYDYAAMNYVFASKSGINAKVSYDINSTLTSKNLDGSNGVETEAKVSNIIPNVPLKENYRTNIVGNLLSSSTTYEIVVDADFETDGNGDMFVINDGLIKNINGDYEVSNENGLEYAIENLFAQGGNFYLTKALYDLTGYAVNPPAVPTGVVLNIYGETPIVTRSASTSFAGITIKGLDSIIETISADANVSISGVELVDEGSVLVETNNGTLVVSESTGAEAIVTNGNDPVEADAVENVDTLNAALASAVKTINITKSFEAEDVVLVGRSVVINGNDKTFTTSASRAFRLTKPGIEVIFNDLKIVSEAVRVGTNDVRGVSVDIVDNITLTLNDCSHDFTDPSANDWAYAVNVTGGTNHTVTVNGGKYEGANVINVRGTAQTVTVKNATLNSTYPNNDVYYGSCIWVQEKQGSSVYAEGNTFNGDNAIAFNLGTGTALEEKDNVDNTKMVVAKVGEAYYTSLPEAFAAAESGATVKVLHNTEMTSKTPVTVASGKTITLDLNGKTITGIDNASGSYGLITNKGNLTVVGPGSMTLTATNNREWNAYSSVISNTVGGNLTVDGEVVIEHLGGTDMAYGIDNLTNGKGTSAITTVNDATIKSTYRAIRQFLNGVEATNELYVNAEAVIEGANKSIWMQDPSTNANTGKLVVEEGAKLYGDVYLFVCAGSESWPVSASIPASTLMDGSEVMTGNVPEGYTVENIGGVWKIIAWTSVSTADELVEALEAKKSVVFANDIKIDPASMSNAYGATGINVKYGQAINGNGYTLNIKGAGGTWDSGINTTGGLIKNLTVTGSFRGIFINHTSTYSEKVVLENVTIGGNGTVYTISCDQGMYQGIEATNCTFNGWTSFAKDAGEAKFVNCSFGEGSGYKYCRPYSNTEFVKCTFCPGYAVDTTRATVTFTDCTWEE